MKKRTFVVTIRVDIDDPEVQVITSDQVRKELADYITGSDGAFQVSMVDFKETTDEQAQAVQGQANSSAQ